MIARTYLERMELIHKLAPKYNRLANMIREAERDQKPVAIKKSFDTHNINHYEDAPKYARKHYGDIYDDTIAMDQDWGDY